MSIPQGLERLAGRWRGTNQLWLHDQDARVFEAAIDVKLLPGDRFALLRYTWADEGRPQDGLLLVGANPETGAVWGAWVDSWHMGHSRLELSGAADDPDKLLLRGSYAAPPGPDWGWRIDLIPRGDDRWRLVMYNITPDGVVEPAVEADYERRDD